jgi:ABC-2 type transport system permease protein
LSLPGAFVRRDFRLETSYRLAFLTQLGGAFTTLLSAGFLSHIVPGNQAALQPYGGDYFTFALIGTAALSYFSVALGSFAGNLSMEQQQGTLEALLVTPTDPRLLLLCGATWPFLFSTVQLVLYLVVGAALFHAKIAADHIVLAGGMLLLTLVAFSAVGLAAASVMVLAKRTGVLIGLVGSAFALLGGVLYPISVLPRPLELLAEALPMVHGLDGVRLALVPDPDLGAIGRDALILVAFAATLIPISLESFRLAIRRARRTGSLSHY